MKKYFVLVLIASLFAVNSLRSQTIKLDSIIANYGDTVLVPLQFYGFLNVGAVTLFIIYDQNVLEYAGMTNLVPEGQGTLTNALTLNDQHVVGIVWSAPGASGVDFPNGKFLDLKFIFTAESSDLVFFEQFCEIVDWDVNPFTVTYIGGRIDHLTNIYIQDDQEFDIYTSNDKLFINIPQVNALNVTVCDILGRTVLLKNLTDTVNFSEISLAHLESGIYIVKVNADNKIFSKKVYLNSNF